MEGDFLFFLKEQVALVGPDTSVARIRPTGQYSHAPVYILFGY